MTSPEFKFEIDEQLRFDYAFPPEEVRVFEQEGADDWIDIFEALSAFSIPEIKPEGRKIVTEQLLSHKYGAGIRTNKTKAGLKVYRRNISPLLGASLDVILNNAELWSEEQKATLNQAFSPKRHAVEDWEK